MASTTITFRVDDAEHAELVVRAEREKVSLSGGSWAPALDERDPSRRTTRVRSAQRLPAAGKALMRRDGGPATSEVAR